MAAVIVVNDSLPLRYRFRYSATARSVGSSLFVALANNQRPDSKDRLTARTNGTRTETRRVFDPKTQTWEEKEIEVSNCRAGYDICLSAPKSVSLYLAMTGNSRLFVQLPLLEYFRLRQIWQLPFAS